MSFKRVRARSFKLTFIRNSKSSTLILINNEITSFFTTTTIIKFQKKNSFLENVMKTISKISIRNIPIIIYYINVREKLIIM